MKYVETACGAKLRTGAKVIASFGMIMCVIGFGMSIHTSLREVCQKNVTEVGDPDGNATHDEVTQAVQTMEINLTTTTPSTVDTEEAVADDQVVGVSTSTNDTTPKPTDNTVVEDPKSLQETEEESRDEGSGQGREDAEEDIEELAGKARREADLPESGGDIDQLPSKDDNDEETKDGNHSSPVPATEKPTTTTPFIVNTTAKAVGQDQDDEEAGDATVSAEDVNQATTNEPSPMTPSSTSSTTTSTTTTTTTVSTTSSSSTTTTPATTIAVPKVVSTEDSPETTVTDDAVNTTAAVPEDDDEGDKNCVKESTMVIAMVSIFVCLLGFAANITLLHSARKSNAKLSMVWLVWVASLYCLQVAAVVDSALFFSPGYIVLHSLMLLFTASCGYIVLSFRKKLLSGHKLSGFGQDMKMSKINDDAYQQLKMEGGSNGSGDARV